jgi:AraC-like DNA-binding protein
LEDRIILRKIDWLHLLPFFVSLVGIVPYLLTPFRHKLETVEILFMNPHFPKLESPNSLLPVEWNLLLRPTLLMAYSVYCMRMIWKAQPGFSGSSSVAQDQWSFLRNWMILLAGILFVMSIPPLVLSYFYSFDFQLDFKQVDAYAVTSATVYTHTLLSVTLLIFPRILYGIPRSTSTVATLNTKERASTTIPSEIHIPDNTDADGREETEKSENHRPFEDLSQAVLQFMADAKPYVDPDFTLDDLARKMGVPKHHLYYCFQNILKTKFTRMRTEFRIEHAKKLLSEADLGKTTLNIVGKESGFASTSAFYSTFKTEEGCSPGEFAARVNPSFPG